VARTVSAALVFFVAVAGVSWTVGSDGPRWLLPSLLAIGAIAVGVVASRVSSRRLGVPLRIVIGLTVTLIAVFLGFVVMVNVWERLGLPH
jgi:hypothetical protein